MMAGAGVKGRPGGSKTGEVMHVFTGDSIQMLRCFYRPGRQRLGGEQLEFSRWRGRRPPAFPTSTWGGGSGFTVIYGVAAPVKPPRMGKVQFYRH